MSIKSLEVLSLALVLVLLNPNVNLCLAALLIWDIV